MQVHESVPAIIGGSSRASSPNLSGIVEVKPQPLGRPSSRTSKDKSSPRPKAEKSSVNDSPARRRGSVASSISSDEGGCKSIKYIYVLSLPVVNICYLSCVVFTILIGYLITFSFITKHLYFLQISHNSPRTRLTLVYN